MQKEWFYKKRKAKKLCSFKEKAGTVAFCPVYFLGDCWFSYTPRKLAHLICTRKKGAFQDFKCADQIFMLDSSQGSWA